MIEDGKFYSLEDVADILGVTYQLIYKLVRSGELGAIRIGKMYRVTSDDLKTYLQHQRDMVKNEVASLTCALCGKNYYSRLSISGECKVCGLPLCRNCVELNHARYCEIHRTEHGNDKE